MPKKALLITVDTEGDNLYNCSYRLTAAYVAEKKKELRFKQKEG